MDTRTALLVELHRLQVLAFLRACGGGPLRTASDLARHLRIGIEESLELVDELVEDGYVAPLPALPSRLVHPLQLTCLATGYLAWMRTRSVSLAGERLTADQRAQA